MGNLTDWFHAAVRDPEDDRQLVTLSGDTWGIAENEGEQLVLERTVQNPLRFFGITIPLVSHVRLTVPKRYPGLKFL